MNIYTAIMKAADTIERYPDSFSFGSCTVPKGHDCGTPGCALGWIAFYLGHERGSRIVEIDAAINRRSEFYDAMKQLSPGYASWIGNAATCAKTLRLYAAKYHAPAKQPPDWLAMAAKQTIAADVRSQEVRA